MSPRRSVLACLAVWALAAPLWAKPTLYIIGDSTVRNGTGGQMGWGDPLVRHFDPAKIDVINRAIGGRSSRTFLTEGRWDAVMANLRPGDFVLVQFGHNDGGPVNDDRCRASLKGIGEESEKIVGKLDGRKETVHTYGWYLRKYASDAKSKGAVPILVSPIPRNIWKDGRLGGGSVGHSLWAKQVAERERLLFIDFNDLLTNRYEALGVDGTARLFAGTDHTHTGPEGAEFNAAVMVEAIRSLKGCYLSKGLLPGDLWLPSVFSDHMVLQRGMPVPVWGMARASAEVSVKLGDKSASAKSDEAGRWKVVLPDLTEGGPFTLEVVSGGTGRRFEDVMVGEVWLCAGQSASVDRTSQISNPCTRVFTVETKLREFPQREVAGKWTVAGAGTTFCFDTRLFQQIQAPLGIIAVTCEEGGLESWIRRETLEAHPQFENLLKNYGRRQIAFRDNPEPFRQYGMQRSMWKSGPAPRNPDPVQDPRSPAVLHNGMIAPIVPYAIRGTVWQNPASESGRPEPDAELQKILIDDWRGLWNMPEIRFYRVTRSSRENRSTAGIFDSDGHAMTSIPSNP